MTYLHEVVPAGDVLFDAAGKHVATLTKGCRTVRLTGPSRTFSEDAVKVTHDTWIRLLQAPYAGDVAPVLDDGWIESMIGENDDGAADVLTFASQYIKGAPAILYDALQIAGDASYGPVAPDGKRHDGSDWNDYLGVWWMGPDGVLRPPDPAQLHCLDCSGFVRMVFGFRSGLPLAWNPADVGAGAYALSGAPELPLPRRSKDLCEFGPGVLTRSGDWPQALLPRLQIGDLVFFDATNDVDEVAGEIDHVGIYMGQDVAGDYRYVSSRKTPDGPTFGDVGGRSCLNGTGTYAKTLRAARRL